MKTLILSFLSVILCNSIFAQTKSSNVIILVRDVSASIKSDTETTSNFLKLFLKKQLKPQTDIVVMNANSTSNAPTNQQVFYYINSYKKPVGFQSDANKILEDSRKSTAQRNDMKLLVSKVENCLSQPIASSSKTYILDLMPKIASYCQSYKTVQLIFVSDLLEDSNRIVLNYFSSKAIAELTAKKAIGKLMTDYNLNRSVFSKVSSITILVPQNVNQNRLINLDFFWQKAFSELGFKHTVSWQSM